MPRSDWTLVSNSLIGIPSLAEQKKIADLLQKIDSEINLLMEINKFFMIQKRGLMQKLLTGKIRIPLTSDSTRSARD